MKRDTVRIVILEDGETFGHLEGSTYADVFAGASVDEIEHLLREGLVAKEPLSVPTTDKYLLALHRIAAATEGSAADLAEVVYGRLEALGIAYDSHGAR